MAEDAAVVEEGPMSIEERRQALEAASLESASSGLKALLALNGSAAIALLAFLANTYSAQLGSERARFVAAAASSLIWFASGAGLAVATSIFAYISNQSYASALALEGRDRNNLWRWGQIWNHIGLGSAVCSLAAFFVGVFLIWSAT